MAQASDTPGVSDTIVVGGDPSDDSVDESGIDHESTADHVSTADHESPDGSGENEVKEEEVDDNQQPTSTTVSPIDEVESAPQAVVFQEPAAENSMHFSSEHESLQSQSQEASSAPDVDMPTQSVSSASPDVQAAIAPAKPENPAVEDPEDLPTAPKSPNIQELIEGITETETDDKPEVKDEVKAETDRWTLSSLPANFESPSTAVPSAPVAAAVFQDTSPAPAPAATPAVVGPASLPPKPNLSLQKASPNSSSFPHHLPAFQHDNSALHPAAAQTSLTAASPVAALGGPNNWPGAPGITPNPAASLPPPPNASYNGAQPHASLPNAMHTSSTDQQWETFQADEKRYTAEAKWERFPDGSRIFIGNLVSEKVSRRQIFDVFSRFGRLAQIAVKSAYGFVQYHTVEDAQAAMQHAQGYELGGRAIHLEISKPQKDKKDRAERDRSPGDRRNSNRNNRGDRYDGREQGGRHGRDDYRPRRSPSPRRPENRGGRDGHARGRDRDYRGPNDRRGRSRSPDRFGRGDGGNLYRRRSPSPRRMSQDVGMNPGLQSQSVPDVQIILMHQLDRQFIDWVANAFKQKGLGAETMYFNPSFNHDSLMQHLIRQGVQAVVELAIAHQTTSKIQVTVFNRSNPKSVRYDRYENLDPNVAADVVLREKAQHPQVAPATNLTYPPYQTPQAGYTPYQAQHQLHQPQPQYPAQPQPQYPAQPQQYGQYAAHYPQAGYATGYAYPNQAQQPPAAPPIAPPAASATPAAPYAGSSQISGLNNDDLQRLLSTLQPGAGGMTQNPPVDVNALLGNLRDAAGPAAGGNAYQNMAAYGHAAVGSNPGTPTVPQHNNMPMNGVGGGGGHGTPQAILDAMNRIRR